MDDQGVLTITGKGNMPNNGATACPWDKYRAQIRSVAIGEGVTSIGMEAFQDCVNLTDVSFSSSVTTIFEGVFAGCTSLATIDLPSNISGIPDRTFAGCTALTELELGEKITYIGMEAFSGCTGLTGIDLPESLVGIEYLAFSGCTGLETITIPKKVSQIKRGTFDNCTGLTTIIFEGNTTLRDTYENPYSTCTSLTRIVLPENSNFRTGEDGVLYNYDGDVYLVPAGYSGSYTVPEGVNKISPHAVEGCTKLTSVDLGSVWWVGQFAFNGCTGMTEVTIPASTTYLGSSAFGGCTALEKATFMGNAPDSHAFIDSVFEGTGADFVIYYPAGADGWTTPTWNGWKTQPVG